MTAERWISWYQLENGSWLFIPNEETKAKGRQIISLIASRWTPPDYYYHMQSGGHVQALKRHSGKRFFIHTDVKSFFNTISKTRVIRELKPYFGYDHAKEIADFSTVRLPDTATKHVLPYGFPQSSIIASICLFKSKMGKLLDSTVQNGHIDISVYVDDIILSADSKDVLDAFFAELKVAAQFSQLILNEEKTEGPSDIVTAFNVDLSQHRLLIEEQRYLSFQTSYLGSTPDSTVRRGILSYISTINEEQVEDLKNLNV